MHVILELTGTRRWKYEKTCNGISFLQKYDFPWMVDFMFNDNNLKKENAFVEYDLAIAKLAKKIQAEEMP